MKQGFLGTQRRSSSRARVRVSPTAADDDEPPPLVCDSDDAGDFDDAASDDGPPSLLNDGSDDSSDYGTDDSPPPLVDADGNAGEPVDTFVALLKHEPWKIFRDDEGAGSSRPHGVDPVSATPPPIQRAEKVVKARSRPRLEPNTLANSSAKGR